MNCIEFRATIAAAVENRTLPPLDIARHLDDCCEADCRASWEDALLLDRAIRDWRRARPASDIVDSVVSRFQSPAGAAGHDSLNRVSGNGRPMRESRMRPIAALVAAAVVLLAALPLLRTTSETMNVSAVRNQKIDPDSPTARDLGAAANEPVPELAYVGYAQNAAQVVTDAVVLTLGNREEMEDSTLAAPGFGWEPTWLPADDDVDSAIDDLLGSLPANVPRS